MRRLWSVVLGLATASAVAGGCAAAGGDAETGGSSAGGATSSATGGDGGGFATGVGGGVGDATCTPDLQSVVSPGGSIETCPPDQGCLDGACVPACDAAAQAQGSIGCEYWAPDPPFTGNGNANSSYRGPCYAVFVANTWGRPATISVRYQGQLYDAADIGRIPSGIGPDTTYAPIPATGLPEGEVAVLFLSHRPGAMHPSGYSLECPVPPAVAQDAGVTGPGRGDAFEVVSDTPITAYDILPYGGATSFFPSAALLFPRTAWGTNYVVTSPAGEPTDGGRWLMLVGTADATTVEVASPMELFSGNGAPEVLPNTPTTLTLDAGEIVQWPSSDPSGAVLLADQPIGVFTGITHLNVPSATSPMGGGTDSAHQQLPPVGALGHEYVAAGVVTRLASMAPESVPYRVAGIVDGTTLTYDPPIPGAPATLQRGESVQFETSELFVVRAQDDEHPFLMSQYMPGAMGLDREGCDPLLPKNGPCRLGDDDWVVLLPPAQFLERYVFFADPTYASSSLVLTRQRGADGLFPEVEVDCLGMVGAWQSVGAGDFEVAHVDLVRGFVGTTAACEASRHRATSAGRFGAVLWGTDHYASYSYPAGGNLGAINDVVVPIPK